jgi:hypothetical protein
MNDLMTRWNASHDRLRAATVAREEAHRASNPSRQQVTRAEEAYQAAVAAHFLIMDEQNAEMDAADRAEEAEAVAAVMNLLKGN